MGVTQGSVQENISKAAAPDVNWLVGYISEDDPVGIHSPVSSLLPDHGLAVWRKADAILIYIAPAIDLAQTTEVSSATTARCLLHA